MQIIVPPSYPRPAPCRHTFDTQIPEFKAVISGVREIRFNPDIIGDGVEVGDVLHLRERHAGKLTGRCCMRLVLKRRRKDADMVPLTIMPGTGYAGPGGDNGPCSGCR